MSARETSGRETDYAAWIEKAEHDLLNIDNNLVAEQVPWDMVCFHAQQAAEKLLKAFLLQRCSRPVRTHDVAALLAECAAIDPALGELEAEGKRLAVYANGSGYPEMWLDPDEREGRHAVKSARRVRSAILGRLARPDRQ